MTTEWYKLNPSSYFVATFGAVSFGLGYLYSQPSLSQNKLWSILTPGILLASVYGIQATVLKEIKVETDSVKDEFEYEARKEFEKRLGDYQKQISASIEAIEEELQSLPVSSMIASVSESVQKIRLADKEFHAQYRASREIVKWLKAREVQDDLLKQAVSKAISNTPFPKRFLRAFKQDIRGSIVWLYYSIDYFTSCRVKPEKCASTLSKIPSGIRYYEVALNEINNLIQEKGKTFSDNSDNLEFVPEFINYLLEEIQSSSRFAA